jgi:nucleotide-binding universal stress UspA family protein
MSGIVCAIRGGPDSQPTIHRSITLAQETGKTIFFLYVVNLDFLSSTATSRTHVVLEEMQEMGEFIMRTAQAQALAKGVSAEIAVRQGHVGTEIIKICQEIQADFVVLGRPRQKAKADVFTQERLNQFAQHIEKESHATVVFAEVGS